MLRVPPSLESLGDLLPQMLDQRVIYVLDVRVISSPLVQPQPLLLLEEGLEQFDVRCVRTAVDHTLEADVLVQPDTPVDLVLLVDFELLAEEIVALLVDFVVVGLVG